MKMLKSKKGFTLTELIIVIVIIGILAAVLIPSLTGYIQKAKRSSAEQDANSRIQEFLSSAKNEDYTELSTAKYLVAIDAFYVIYDKGALVKSYENEELTVVNPAVLKSLDNIETTDYIYINISNQIVDVENIPTVTFVER